MKRLSLIAFGLCLGILSQAQQQASDENLSLIYGAEKIVSLQSDNTEQLEFLRFENESGYYIAEMPGDKQISSYPDALDFIAVDDAFAMLSVELLESGVLLGAYGFEVSDKAYGYYRVGDSSTLMVVYPRELIQVLYEREQ